MYSCTMPVSDPWPPTLQKGCECLKKIHALYDIASIYGNGLGLVENWGVFGWFGVFLGGLWCLNGPHDGYANS